MHQTGRDWSDASIINPQQMDPSNTMVTSMDRERMISQLLVTNTICHYLLFYKNRSNDISCTF